MLQLEIQEGKVPMQEKSMQMIMALAHHHFYG